jgi:CubicO group peptidase (beta-lactamase class C family)
MYTFSHRQQMLIVTICLITSVFAGLVIEMVSYADKPGSDMAPGISTYLLRQGLSEQALSEQVGGLNSDPDLEKLDAYIEANMRQNRIPGMALAITQGERILYLQGYGSSFSNQAVTPKTPFYIGSVSKSFTALAVLQLVEQGLIELDAPIQAYIPWFQVANESYSSAITARHLLNQTSGMSRSDYNRDLLPADATIEEAVRNLKVIQPSQPPGENLHYFNANYTILGYLVEEVSGLGYGEYLQERIFKPLDMERSFTDPQAARAVGLAQGHTQMLSFPLPRQ